MRLLRALVVATLVAGGAASARAEVPVPDAPARWATDRAGFLSPAALSALDDRLGAYASQTGHQVLVYIDRTTGGVPIEDWAARAFQRWRIGRKGLDDGVALFIFSDDHHLRIEVGYGLEGNLPDAVASRIINERMVPLIRAGDRDRAVSAGVDGIVAAVGAPPGSEAARGLAQPSGQAPPPHLPWWGWIVGALLLVAFLRFAVRHPVLASMMMMNIGSGRRGGGGWGGGGFGGGGGGGFSGGGGGSGGGGASGSW